MTCAEGRGRRWKRGQSPAKKEKSKKFSRKTGKETKYIIQQVIIQEETLNSYQTGYYKKRK